MAAGQAKIERQDDHRGSHRLEKDDTRSGSKGAGGRGTRKSRKVDAGQALTETDSGSESAPEAAVQKPFRASETPSSSHAANPPPALMRGRSKRGPGQVSSLRGPCHLAGLVQETFANVFFLLAAVNVLGCTAVVSFSSATPALLQVKPGSLSRVAPQQLSWLACFPSCSTASSSRSAGAAGVCWNRIDNGICAAQHSEDSLASSLG